MMKNIIYTLCTLFFCNYTFAQGYQDYIGAGHDDNITVTSSSDFGNATAQKTIDGSGFLSEQYKAARFLGQATLGFDTSDISQVLALGYEGWIDAQIALDTSEVLPMMNSIHQEYYDAAIADGADPDMISGRNWTFFNYAWWHNMITGNDKLRQKIALALSEIFVISNQSNVGSFGWASSFYYDRFLKEAFGNYKDILYEVSLDPNMGYYLSHLNNPKTDTSQNIHPDENYAREIMQLFSIGLYKLNMDGTRMTDMNGDDIPTYDNNDIKGLAKVFTGLGAGDIEDYVDWTSNPYFGLGYWGTNKMVQMAMYESNHEPGEKHLFDGNIIPDGQTGMEDIDDAIDLLFAHDNVAPFICRRLIQNLVKSNPSPDYLSRVSNIFADNGSGVRGDLEAVVKAILLDEEARSDAYLNEFTNGKLRSPILRYTNFVKAIPNENDFDRFWNIGYGYSNDVGQFPLDAQSVFNFYLPDFQPTGEIIGNDLYAPEFQLHNTKTILNYYNKVYRWTVEEYPYGTWIHDTLLVTNVEMNMMDLESLYDQPEELMNTLDMMFTYGTLTDRTKDFIKSAILEVNESTTQSWNIPEYRIELALYLLLVSPDYAIMK